MIALALLYRAPPSCCLASPTSLVVEITSPSTHATDRHEKLEAYMRVASLQLYLIVDQRRKHVTVYSRDGASE